MRPAVAYRTVGLAAALVAGALLAQALMTLLVAVIVAIILSLPLSAAASGAQRRGVPRALGALGALVTATEAAAGGRSWLAVHRAVSGE